MGSRGGVKNLCASAEHMIHRPPPVYNDHPLMQIFSMLEKHHACLKGWGRGVKTILIYMIFFSKNASFFVYKRFKSSLIMLISRL